MTTTIRLTGLAFSCRIGINPGEQDVPQPVRMDVAVDLTAAPATDSPALDYAELAERLRRLAGERPWGLVEELAGACVAMIRASFRCAGRICIQVYKPNALAGGGEPSVECVLEAGEGLTAC